MLGVGGCRMALHNAQHIGLQLPVISTFEWHPFTLSSAPEDKFISVHIRTAGDWTGDVYQYFSVRACWCLYVPVCACDNGLTRVVSRSIL